MYQNNLQRASLQVALERPATNLLCTVGVSEEASRIIARLEPFLGICETLFRAPQHGPAIHVDSIINIAFQPCATLDSEGLTREGDRGETQHEGIGRPSRFVQVHHSVILFQPGPDANQLRLEGCCLQIIGLAVGQNRSGKSRNSSADDVKF